jgi:preprotein translocase subunit YajC
MSLVPFLMAMGTPAASGVNPMVTLIPYALVAVIFYVVVILPMQRQQKKVKSFLASLKVGDRVVTSGGLYGSITRVGDEAVQMQIADKVRIEVSRNAIVGYQGQEPAAPQGPQ